MMLDIFLLIFCGSLFFFLAYHIIKDLREFKRENEDKERLFEREALEFLNILETKENEEDKKSEKSKKC